MKTIEILSEMNIHFDEATDSLFDYILECKIYLHSRILL